jgi:hypothetical protein
MRKLADERMGKLASERDEEIVVLHVFNEVPRLACVRG